MFHLSTLRRSIISIVMILMVTVMAAPTFAQTCDAAVQDANAKLDEAKSSIEAGDTANATTLINEAQALLSGCGAESSTGTTTTTMAANATVNMPDLDPEATVTFIAFVHTSPDVGPIDLYTNDIDEPIVTNLAF